MGRSSASSPASEPVPALPSGLTLSSEGADDAGSSSVHSNVVVSSAWRSSSCRLPSKPPKTSIVRPSAASTAEWPSRPQGALPVVCTRRQRGAPSAGSASSCTSFKKVPLKPPKTTIRPSSVATATCPYRLGIFTPAGFSWLHSRLSTSNEKSSLTASKLLPPKRSIRSDSLA